MPRSPADHPARFVSVPTPATRWWRTFLPYQLVRFALINVKMLRLLRRAHRDTPPPV